MDKNKIYTYVKCVVTIVDECLVRLSFTLLACFFFFCTRANIKSTKTWCIQPKYRRTDILVCKAYDLLEHVSCNISVVAHLLLALKEIMATARDARDHTNSHCRRVKQISGVINAEKDIIFTNQNCLYYQHWD